MDMETPLASPNEHMVEKRAKKKRKTSKKTKKIAPQYDVRPIIPVSLFFFICWQFAYKISLSPRHIVHKCVIVLKKNNTFKKKT